jgi:hypothetical protein
MSEIHSHSAIKNEHYSPALLTECATKTMGFIELDPASDPLGNSLVKASRYFTKDQDGYTKEWTATTVYCNPPGRINKDRKMPGSSDWFKKMHYEWLSRRFEEGIFICYSADILSKIAEIVEHYELAICYPKPSSEICSGMGRICFLSHDGGGNLTSQKSPPNGNAIIYFHSRPSMRSDKEKFKNCFEPIGTTLIHSKL